MTSTHSDQKGDATTTVEPVNPDSFDEAFADLWRLAYRVAYRILGRRTEAEDVAQETLIRVHLHWRKVHGYAQAWAAKVAANLAIDTYRRRSGSDSGLGIIEAGPDSSVVDRIDVVRLLQRLPRRQREVLALRYLADQTESATAAAMGCSLGAVKRYAHRALSALREIVTVPEDVSEFDDHGPDPDPESRR